MSTSIFSSFDALCAESFFGQKISFFGSPAPSNGTNTPAGRIDGQRKGREVNSPPSQPEKKPEDRRRIRAPRFAPELDGLYCFETILPY